ncbi:Organic hydroperoxide resistance protein OhrB [Streptomyces sp. RB5]|uniref:Organic hydroperoxide resistance protein OhrB n=1 Tax=Streptomyces smaragdinus TaxID=2585196 RepID=A0A7K0CJT8_9ACTN|nr:organic hydroperoxide resistance protein [Streptomyces smaragdinus]MQY13716.1 Organic hydroperoxide resistance protein OhrB [Streptomyces smaragdinus]
MSAQYTAVGTATGRKGRGYTTDGKLDVRLDLPKELGGGDAGTNPEQLFAVGYAACFASAMEAIAGKRKLDVSEVSTTAEVGLGADGKGGFELSVTLRVEFPEGFDGTTARELVDATHQFCPYSRATRGNIPVEIVVE